MPKQESKLELEQRAERIQTTIALLREQLSEIEAEGVVAPPGCYVARYQAKGAKHHYWYYQLKATTAIFPKTNKKKEYSRFQHLGKAGSQAHIDGVLAVVRRVQIDELTKTIDGLNESWSDLYTKEEKVGHRVE
ncbi:hypothetical protein IQ255_06245 [Pleurocapsales cyanobacterium LEGE 10410]|nr:hypothetical protein [Pleurocapsales cyanobacterium LEGE 10410]